MEGTPAEVVTVPYTELSPELLRAVVESFVLREGTDYGMHEVPLNSKVSQVRKQLEQIGRAHV